MFSIERGILADVSLKINQEISKSLALPKAAFHNKKKGSHLCVSFTFFSLFLSCSLSAVDFHDFDPYQSHYSRKIIEERIKTYLIKDLSLTAYFDLTEEGLILYRSPKNIGSPDIEYILKLTVDEVPPVSPVKSSGLSGVKIAIDPGHLGGPFAELEERYIEIDNEKEPSIFDEGTLSLLTAKHLKELLEKEGAVVLLTRDEIGKGVYEKDFFQWLKSEPALWKEKLTLNQLFTRYYNPLDLRARAEKINQFKPDLTIAIHYNAHPVEGGSSNNHTTIKNYNMVFIPGAFGRKELVDPENRYEFMRLLLTDDWEISKKLSRAVLSQFTEILQVPSVQPTDNVLYLDHVGLKVCEGIYARNLVLTRLVHGPICYGESLIQNNEKECLLLNQKDTKIAEVPCSSRIKEVAISYFNGIKAFLTLLN